MAYSCGGTVRSGREEMHIIIIPVASTVMIWNLSTESVPFRVLVN